MGLFPCSRHSDDKLWLPPICKRWENWKTGKFTETSTEIALGRLWRLCKGRECKSMVSVPAPMPQHSQAPALLAFPGSSLCLDHERMWPYWNTDLKQSVVLALNRSFVLTTSPWSRIWKITNAWICKHCVADSQVIRYVMEYTVHCVLIPLLHCQNVGGNIQAEHLTILFNQPVIRSYF